MFYKPVCFCVFSDHLYTKHKISVGRFAKDISVCPICGFSTAKKFRYKEHMNMHNNEREHKCSHCGEGFYSRSTLKDHIKWKHSNEQFKCNYCAFTGPTKYHVMEHTRYMHTHRDLKPYKCAYCDYRCNVSGNCRKHIMNRHKDREVRWIKVCDKYPQGYQQDKIEHSKDGDTPVGNRSGLGRTNRQKSSSQAPVTLTTANTSSESIEQVSSLCEVPPAHRPYHHQHSGVISERTLPPTQSLNTAGYYMKPPELAMQTVNMMSKQEGQQSLHHQHPHNHHQQHHHSTQQPPHHSHPPQVSGDSFRSSSVGTWMTVPSDRIQNFASLYQPPAAHNQAFVVNSAPPRDLVQVPFEIAPDTEPFLKADIYSG